MNIKQLKEVIKKEKDDKEIYIKLQTGEVVRAANIYFSNDKMVLTTETSLSFN